MHNSTRAFLVWIILTLTTFESILSQQNVRFRVDHGNIGNAIPTRVIDTTRDGGFIIGGSHWYQDVPCSNLTKTNSLGQIEWSKIYFFSRNNIINDVKQTKDGGYLFTGHADNATQWPELQLVKTDSLGNQEWAYTYTNYDGNSATSAAGFQIILDTASYYIFGGFDHTPGAEGLALLQVDFLGNIINSKSYYYPTNNTNNGYGRITFQRLQNGNFVGAASCLNVSELVILVDPNGNLLSYQSYTDSTTFAVAPLALYELNNGNILIAGCSANGSHPDRLTIQTVTTNGTVVESHSIDTYCMDMFNLTATITDRTILFSGSIRQNPNNDFHMFHVITDHNGAILSGVIDTTKNGIGFELIPTTDHGLIAPISVIDYASESTSTSQVTRSYLVKYDSLLQTSCSNSNFHPRNYATNLTNHYYGCYSVPNEFTKYTMNSIQLELTPYSKTMCIDSAIATNEPDMPFDNNLFVPNAFSPNNDGNNDIFLPLTSDMLKFFSLTIYNRWGEVIFKSNDHLIGWDGTVNHQPCPQGVYVWKCEYQFDSNPEMQTRIGHLVIIK